jgi:hypothetical protein
MTAAWHLGIGRTDDGGEGGDQERPHGCLHPSHEMSRVPTDRMRSVRTKGV